MGVILRVFRLLKDNIMAVLLALGVAYAARQSIRLNNVTRENEELERDVQKLEIEAEADEVRDRPVPRNKSVILGRM